jgi:RNA polymerase sigma factor (sigma-70 family)
MSALFSLLATTQILQRGTQIELVRIAQNSNDNEALDALIKSNLPMAVKIAKKHVRNGIDIEDLTAEAITGIIRAVDTFNPEKGASFTTYAAQWMRAKCQEFVQANCGTLRVGTRSAKKLHAGVARIRRTFGSDVSNEIIARELGLDEAEVADILPLISTRAASLNAPIGTDGATFGETLVDDNINQFDKLERTRNSEAIAAAVVDFSNNLKDKQRAIFNGRILAEYLGNDKVSANDFGVSKQRVGQIEKDLTAKLRNHLTNRGLGL